MATLREVDEVRRRTRAAVHPAWFPLVLFGLLGLAATPFGFLGDGWGLGLFWLVAWPAGAYATRRHYHDRALGLGVCVEGGIYTVLGVAFFVAAWVVGATTRSAVGPMLVVAAAYLAFARLERSWPVAGVSIALGAAVAAVAARHTAHPDAVLTLAFGLAFTTTGLVLRHGDRG
ncbi:MAG: hypothetical protein ABR511_14615 [Acidimicrobiales bacterium]